MIHSDAAAQAVALNDIFRALNFLTVGLSLCIGIPRYGLLTLCFYLSIAGKLLFA